MILVKDQSIELRTIMLRDLVIGEGRPKVYARLELLINDIPDEILAESPLGSAVEAAKSDGLSFDEHGPNSVTITLRVPFPNLLYKFEDLEGREIATIEGHVGGGRPAYRIVEGIAALRWKLDVIVDFKDIRQLMPYIQQDSLRLTTAPPPSPQMDMFEPGVVVESTVH